MQTNIRECGKKPGFTVVFQDGFILTLTRSRFPILVSPTLSLQGCVKTYLLISLASLPPLSCSRLRIQFKNSNASREQPSSLPPSLLFIWTFALVLCNNILDNHPPYFSGLRLPVFHRLPCVMRAFLQRPGRNQSWRCVIGGIRNFLYSDTRILL